MKKILIIFFLFLAFSTKGQQSIPVEEIDSLNLLGSKYTYVHKDSAYYYFDKAYEKSKNANHQKSRVETLFNYVGTASYHHDLKKMEASLGELGEILGSLDDFEKPTFQENIYLLTYYRGIYEYLVSRTKNAIRTFENIIGHIKNIPDSSRTQDLKSLLSGSYSFIGKLYVEQGKYNLAKDLYNNSIRNILDKNSDNLESLYGNYNLLAEVYTKQNLYSKANKYLHKTLKYNRKEGNMNTVISTAFYLSQNYTKIKNQDSALFYLNEAKLAFNNNPVFYSKYHSLKSNIYKNVKEYDLALKELEISEQEIKKRFGNEKNIDLAILQNEMGVINTLINENEKALLNYDLALNQIGEHFKNSFQTIKILKNKARLLNKGKASSNYLKTIEITNDAIQILDHLKPTFKSQNDKLVLIEDSFPLFESGIEAAFKLYNGTKEEKYTEIAFNYLEKSKSVLLLEALLSTKATEFANIPNNLLEKERQLKSEINYLEKLLHKKSEAQSDKEEQLFEFQEEYRQLITKIETDYKRYYDLKYNTKTLSLLETQKLLKQDEKLISYFYGNDAIYAIAVDKTSKQFERIPIDAALENTIKQAHKMLGTSKSDVSTLSKASYKLYKNVLAPFATSNEKKKLIIIADGLLNYIPFGALNTEENGLSYLTESHAISYINSATLYSQLKDRDKKEGDLLAFAPKFSGEQVHVDPSRDKLLPLPHNTREAKQILNSFPGQSYLNENASLQNFTSKLSKYGMLHLATHAVFDDTAPEYSYLAFSNADNQENLLYVSDLYNLQIDADLVTLSACESGVGELKRGEGFLSLARGFFYSGASSIASTLWKVNDASTATLMDSFYKNLSGGDSKDVALQKSQISFLESNRQNGLAHPYYWSGFIVSGNTEPLTTTNYWFWIGLGTLLSIFAGFLVFGKKNEG